ncbi:MAG: heparinase II/III family protein, partial [Armatimonadota bacterium]
KDPFVMVARHGNRKSLEAFLWGVDELPDISDVELQSRNYTGLGAAILRQGAGQDQQYLHLDYGPHGGGHGHLDKLAMILFDRGRQLAPDPGRLAYAAPLQKTWYKHTFAHNTVCVDERDQARSEGELTAFISEPEFAAAQAVCDTAYGGVTMRRTMAITGDYVIDVFETESDEEHTYDWLYHNFGTLEPDVSTEAHPEPLSEDDGYQHFTDISHASASGDWSATFALEDTEVKLTMLGEEGTEVYFGTGIAGKPPEPCPMVVVRRSGKTAQYISLMEPKEPGTPARTIRRLGSDEDVVALAVEGENSTDLFVCAPDEAERTVAGVQVSGKIAFMPDVSIGE